MAVLAGTMVFWSFREWRKSGILSSASLPFASLRLGSGLHGSEAGLTFRGHEHHVIDAVTNISEQDLLLGLILQSRYRLVGVVYGHHRADGEAEVSAYLVC